MSEDYELMPHQTIVNIKHELEILKKKAGSMQEISSKEFKESIDKLNEKINSLLSLFQEAAKGMTKEEDTLVQRMNTLEEENRKIAEGILVIADMVKELKTQPQMPKPVIRQMPQTPPRMPLPAKPPPMMPPRQPIPPQMAEKPFMPQRVAPRPMPPGMPPQGPSPLPPLPEIRAGPQKEGLISKIFKKK